MENLYVDIGALRVNAAIGGMTVLVRKISPLLFLLREGNAVGLA